MAEDNPKNPTSGTAGTDEPPPRAAPGKSLSPAALRALHEAQARREKAGHEARPKELGGPKGDEPTRFGDWERSGRAVDF